MSQPADIRWCEQHLNGEHSVVALLKLPSEKPKKTTKDSGLTFYPLHIYLKIISEPMQHLMTIHAHKLLSFLLVQFRHEHGATYGDQHSRVPIKTENIHHCITHEMKPLSDTALRIIKTRTTDKKRFRLHVVIELYSGEITAQKRYGVCQVFQQYETNIPGMKYSRGRPENSKSSASWTAEERSNSLSEYGSVVYTA